VLFRSYPNSQFAEREDILNVGGFSDTVFDVIDMFIRCGDAWVDTIKAVEI